MIDVTNLTKRYGDVLAVNNVSFSIRPGEVVGLLGPNGAGKTTILRILTGYLPATQGSARLAEYEVSENSLEVRRRIGYLPETNPLYEDMAVYEALQWMARLRGLEDSASHVQIRAVVESCGLGSVVGKNISQLSKGYRQRVGLAQAMLHDPEILILDEPTSGLDPNQQLEVRQLIQALKKKKTVLLSTHILSEAQTACDRVLIIHAGQIVADGTPDQLGRQLAGTRRLTLELKAPPKALDVLAQVPGVERVTLQKVMEARSLFTLEFMPSMDVREQVFEVAVSNRWPILGMTQETLSLEDIFRQLTTGAAQ